MTLAEQDFYVALLWTESDHLDKPTSGSAICVSCVCKWVEYVMMVIFSVCVCSLLVWDWIRSDPSPYSRSMYESAKEIIH